MALRRPEVRSPGSTEKHLRVLLFWDGIEKALPSRGGWHGSIPWVHYQICKGACFARMASRRPCLKRGCAVRAPLSTTEASAKVLFVLRDASRRPCLKRGARRPGFVVASRFAIPRREPTRHRAKRRGNLPSCSRKPLRFNLYSLGIAVTDFPAKVCRLLVRHCDPFCHNCMSPSRPDPRQNGGSGASWNLPSCRQGNRFAQPVPFRYRGDGLFLDQSVSASRSSLRVSKFYSGPIAHAAPSPGDWER